MPDMIEPRYGWETVLCVASGPSFNEEQAQQIRDAHSRGGFRVIAVNDNWKRVPSADLLYACDGEWWDYHYAEVKASYQGECWTESVRAAGQYGLRAVWVDARATGLCRYPDRIHGGGNSGYQVVNLAYLFGARRIILVGYDMKDTYGKSHWFGRHPPGLERQHPYISWIRRFDLLYNDLATLGVEVVNCSIETALTTVPRSTLEKEFGRTPINGSCLDSGRCLV